MRGIIPLLLCGILMSGCPSIPPLPVKAIHHLGSMRSKAEQWARIVHKDFPPGGPSHKEARKRYITAKAACDAWVDLIRVRLTEGSLEDADYNTAVEKARDAMASYLSYVRKLMRSEDPMALGLVDEIGKILIDAGIAIWREARAAAAENLKAVKEELERFRWTDWDKLK